MNFQVMKPRQGFSGSTVERLTDWLRKMEITSKRYTIKHNMSRIRGFWYLLGNKIGFLRPTLLGNKIDFFSPNEAQAYGKLNFISGHFISLYYSNHRKIINLDEDTNLKITSTISM